MVINKSKIHFESKSQRIYVSSRNDLHIKGLAIDVNVESANYAKTIKEKCLKNGLILTSQQENLVMYPALNITGEDAKKDLAL